MMTEPMDELEEIEDAKEKFTQQIEILEGIVPATGHEEALIEAKIAKIMCKWAQLQMRFSARSRARASGRLSDQVF